jgi:hypothetical protein
LPGAGGLIVEKAPVLADEVTHNLQGMDELGFKGWNGADWQGVFAHCHTDGVPVDVHGQPQTHGIQEHIAAMKASVETTGGTPGQITSRPIRFGSGDWTSVVGEFQNGGLLVCRYKRTAISAASCQRCHRMVTLALAAFRANAYKAAARSFIAATPAQRQGDAKSRPRALAPSQMPCTYTSGRCASSRLPADLDDGPG